jgi:hypothetical protein
MLTLADIDVLYGYEKDGVLAGWAGVKIYSNKYVLKMDFVREEFRGLGIYKQLIKIRLKVFHDKPIEAFCTPSSFPCLSRHGFVTIKEYKNGCKKIRRAVGG